MTTAFKKRIAKMSVYQLVDECDTLARACGEKWAIGDADWLVEGQHRSNYVRDELKRRIAELEADIENLDSQLEYERKHPKNCDCRECKIG